MAPQTFHLRIGEGFRPRRQRAGKRIFEKQPHSHWEQYSNAGTPFGIRRGHRHSSSSSFDGVHSHSRTMDLESIRLTVERYPPRSAISESDGRSALSAMVSFS